MSDLIQASLAEIRARLAGGELLDLRIELVTLTRNEAFGLDLEQRGRDEQKIARDVQVEVLHAGHLGQILVGDLRDVDGADVDLLAAHQVEEQIEGTLERIYAHTVGHSRITSTSTAS